MWESEGGARGKEEKEGIKDIEGEGGKTEKGKKVRRGEGEGEEGEKEGERGGTGTGISCLYMPSFLGNQLPFTTTPSRQHYNLLMFSVAVFG